jgi:hypothetical protein
MKEISGRPLDQDDACHLRWIASQLAGGEADCGRVIPGKERRGKARGASEFAGRCSSQCASGWRFWKPWPKPVSAW